MHDWIENHLKSYCAKHFKADETVILNFTGGTKPLSYLLIQAYDWTYTDYQAFGTDYIDRCTIGQHQLKFSQELLLIDKLSVLDHAALYVDHISLEADNEIEQHPLSLEIAELRFKAQRLEQATADNLFPVITPKLETLWFNKKGVNANLAHQENKRWICKWQLFESKNFPLTSKNLQDLKAFFQKLYQLDSSLRDFKILDDHIEIPLYNTANQKAWCFWIAGGWFEQLIYQWLVNQGIKKIQKNMILYSKNNDNTDNNKKPELDIILSHKNKLSVFELKCDIPHNSKLNDIRKQLNDNTTNFGKITAAIVLSSIIKKHHNRDQIADFEDKCKADNKKVFWVDSKEDFIESLQKDKII